VFVILAYAPILLCLPVLLVVGLIFVVVPGGFIIVLGALYYVAVGVAGSLGLAAIRRLGARVSRVRRTGPSFENASPSRRSSSGRRGAIAPRQLPVGFTNDRAVGSAANVLRRRGSDDVDLVAPLERGRVPDRHDGARAV
jgi:energy-converting hydrogenase Eha subunit C